jgi:S1-C subfamily serine protease
VVEVVPGSPLDKAGIERGDMIYTINGFNVDRFGEMNVPWSEDKIGLSDLVNRLSIGDNVPIVVYRKGKRIEHLIEFNYASQPAIRRVYPGYEPIDYEIFGGMVVMELTMNHVEAFKDRAIGLAKYLEFRHQAEPVLIVTHIFSNSQLYRSRILSQGIILNKVNDMKVCTLADFREAIKSGANSKFLTMLVSDTINRSSDNIFVVLPMQQLLAEEPQLAKAFRYPLTAMTMELTQEFLRLKNNEPALVVAQAVPLSGS